MTDAANDAPALDPRYMKYKRSTMPKLSHDAATRQGTITRLALEKLGNKEDAIAYLNLERAALGGRPIDLATATVDGFKRVEQDLSALDIRRSSAQGRPE